MNCDLTRYYAQFLLGSSSLVGQMWGKLHRERQCGRRTADPAQRRAGEQPRRPRGGMGGGEHHHDGRERQQHDSAVVQNPVYWSVKANSSPIPAIPSAATLSYGNRLLRCRRSRIRPCHSNSGGGFT